MNYLKTLSALLFIFSLSVNLNAQVMWEENFDSLNTDLWNIIEGDGCPGLCGWGNSERQYYADDNVYIEEIPGEEGNFGLVIEARDEVKGGRAFTSGRINTEGKVEITYGLIEIRMMIPDLETGLWPAAWLLGANHSEVGWPESGEIDIMEMGHKEEDRARQGFPNSTENYYVGANAIWYATAACQGVATCAASIANDVDYNTPYVADSSMANRFVIYRLYWNTTSLRFTIIDQETEYDLYTGPFNISGGEAAEAFKNPFFLLFNMAVGGNFTDVEVLSDVTAPLPAKLYIDYVRVSKYGGSGFVNFISDVSNEEADFIPGDIKLYPNYPNPFNPSTSIQFELNKPGNVKLSVYDMSGREIKTLVNRTYSQGKHSVQFNATGIASGIYFYKMEANGQSLIRKMTLIK